MNRFDSLELLRQFGARIVTDRVSFAEESGKIVVSLVVGLTGVCAEPPGARSTVHQGQESLA